MNVTQLIQIFNNHKPQTLTQEADAAVLIPIIQHPTGLSLLFTVRTQELLHHAGQICFPGGRREPQDASLVITALREAHEEVGLHAEKIQVLGSLEPLYSSSKLLVTPIVAVVTPPLDLVIQIDEVAQVFEVPIDFLLTESNYQTLPYWHEGKEYLLPEISYQDFRIWGLTAKILKNFLQLCRGYL